jgi:hypothetical protein
MYDFNDLIFEPRVDRMSGFAAEIHFKNGYGVSVICGERYYCSPRINLSDALMYDEYEVGLLKDGALTYDTPYDNEVLGYVSKSDIVMIIDKLQSLT